MRRSDANTPDPVKQYAVDVMAGNVIAGRLVRLACERHLRDLKEGGKRGLVWDRQAAAYAISWIELLSLPDRDSPFLLSPFQKFIVGSLFGWKTREDLRRFRTAYIEIGKGSGKSPLAAAIGLFMLTEDGQEGAEVYAAATTLDQAAVCFRDAKNIAERTEWLTEELAIDLANIAHPASRSFLRKVSGEHRGLDGKRVHCGLVDELHEHPTPTVVDKIRAGTKNRKEALIFEITNSGYDRTTVCWQHHEYSAKILEGVLENDSWFAYVCQLDTCEKCRKEGKSQPTEGCPDCDDWRDERVWIKANPNLGVSIPLSYLREQVAEAVGMPTKEGIVKRLNFCIWTQQITKAIPMDLWDACAEPLVWEPIFPTRSGGPGKGAPPQPGLCGDPRLVDREAYFAMDIGAVSDFCAFSGMFPRDDVEEIQIATDEGPALTLIRRSYDLRAWLWLPERPVKRDEKMETVIDAWVKKGFIRRTQGDVVDYDEVMEDIKALSEKYRIVWVGFDRGFQGVRMEQLLLSHFGREIVESVHQGITTLAPAFREFLELVKLGRMRHDGLPPLRWMASNTAAEERGGLSKPSKDASPEKIDGITAAVTALVGAMANPVNSPSVEVW